MAPGVLVTEDPVWESNGVGEPLRNLAFAAIQPCKLPILDEHLKPRSGRGSLNVTLPSHRHLRLFCKDNGASEFQVLQVVWSLLLRCYTGNDTICFGLSQAKTGHLGYNSKVNGCDDPRLDLRHDTISATDTFAAILRRFAQHATAWNEWTNDSCKERLQAPVDTVLLDQTVAETFVFNPTVVVTFSSDCDGLNLNYNYKLSALNEAAAFNIANTFEAIVDTALTQPLQQIGDLDIISAHDIHQTSVWNKKVVIRSEACVHHLLETHAFQTPKAPAINSHDGSLNYDELNDLSSQVAEHLITLGVGPGILVPICFEKSVWAVIAMVAILKAGGAFVPLDPLHPIERLNAIIRKTQAIIVVTSATHSALFGDSLATTCVVGQALADLRVVERATSSIKDRVHPNNVAFVLFTSGSTGEPKGIVQEHGSVCTNALAHGPALGMGPASRVLQFAAFTFDVSMMDIFTTLILGGCVCIPSEHDRMNDIVGFINATQVNWALLTPSFSNLIEPEDVPTLQTLALGGEAVTDENIQRWANKVSLLNCYGPAEVGACIISATPINSNARSETVGQRLDSTLCWLVDPMDHNKLVPVGSIGELCVQGPTLARGYLNDAVLTAAQFIENPPWLQQEVDRKRRIYKVGDLLRQNSNGSFDFVGRIDSQIKIRGQRVELGEVEHQLSSHPEVAACVVGSPKSGQYQKCLVGVVQLQESLGISAPLHNYQDHSELQVRHSERNKLSTSELVRHMQERLPPYMVPNSWIIVDKIPLSTSAKIDRKKVITWLTEHDRPVNGSQVENVYESATSSLLSQNERVAMEISTQVAHMIAPENKPLFKRIEGHNVVFTAIGLDSIQVISLAMFIRRTYDVHFGVEQLTHKDSSVRNLANKILEVRRGTFNGTTRKTDLEDERRLLSQQLKHRALTRRLDVSTVFLTGATGFLGMQILQTLLSQPNVHKVVAYVRANSAVEGLARIVKAASLAGWWSESLLSRLEIWPGDLELPKLGLTSSQWDRIKGIAGADERIDSIIHNGASVRWNADFETLKATNVGATMELLNALIDSHYPPNLVYVSGGQALTPNDETDEQVLDQIALANGYCQTKAVSELLVKDLMQIPRYTIKLSIVKPSYIIGSPDTGVANTADYLWRLVGSCIDINAYNAADQDSWLYVSDVDHIASTIIDSCDNTTRNRGITKILDGIYVKDLWGILTQEFGYDIRPLAQDVWMDTIRKDVECKREEHRLWPLLDTLEEGKGRIGAIGVPASDADATLRVKMAIWKNVEYLIMTGFIPQAPEKA